MANPERQNEFNTDSVLLEASLEGEFNYIYGCLSGDYAIDIKINGSITLGSASGHILDSNGNELIKGTHTASAVNEITIANAATGNGPTVSATGGDTNIDLNLNAKGTGNIATTTGPLKGGTWIRCIGGVQSGAGAAYAETANGDGRFYGDFNSTAGTLYLDVSDTGGGGDGYVELYDLTNSAQIAEHAFAGGFTRAWYGLGVTMGAGAASYAIRIKRTSVDPARITYVYNAYLVF